MRECPRCGVTKPLAEFPNGARKDGTHTYCRTCMNAYKRGWYSEHREQEIARCTAYNQANHERHRSTMRAYHATTKGKATRRKYVEANRERYQVHDQNKRARRQQAMQDGPGITPQQWADIKAKHRNRCAYCGEKKPLTMDHIVPLSRGGKHEPDNIAPACKPCNNRKHATDPIDFANRIGRLL